MPRISRRTVLQALPWLGIGIALPRRAQAADSLAALSRQKIGDSVKVEALLEVGGDFNLKEQGLPRTMKMSVVGRMGYVERLLQSDDKTTALLTARRYETAEAVIKIDKGGTKPLLRNDRRLIGVSITPTDSMVFSPEGPLTREELDLIDIPANSAIVDRLLPGRDVRIGDRWQHSDGLLGLLLGLDAVSNSEVYSQLLSFDGVVARLEFAGPVHGAIHGVATDIQLKGRYKFDAAAGRITWLAMLVEEQRSIGHVGPGADVTSRLQMTIAPAEPSVELTDESVAGGAWNPAQAFTDLEYRSTQGGFKLLHGRHWHVMNDTREAVAMRLVERGDLVAQCNVSALPKTDPGKHLPIERFQQDIQAVLDKNFGQFVQASERTSPHGHILYRVVAAGLVNELPIQWIYYLVADREGRQVVLAFTVEAEQLPQLAESDQAIAESLEFIEPATAAVEPLGANR